MSNHAAIRAAIVAQLQTVPGIGTVHDYERYGKNESTFRQLYAYNGGILGWHVRRKSIWQTQPFVGRWTITQEWEIRGQMAIADAEASEKSFDGLIDLMQDVFRDDPTVGGVVATTVLGSGSDDPAGLQLDESGPVMFCGVLCHGARLSLFTRHYLAIE